MRGRGLIRSLYGPGFLPGRWFLEVMAGTRRVLVLIYTKNDLGVLRR